MFRKIALGIFALFGLLLTFGSEHAYDSSFNFGGEDRLPITISHTAWDDAIGASHVMNQVLESVGFDVTLVQLDPAFLFASIATGETDASVSPWVPINHDAYMQEYGDQIENLGPHTTGAVNGLVVPTYMEDINSITDLTEEAGQVIKGIEPGAVLANVTDQAIQEVYPNLSGWTQQTSSTAGMLTELGQAYENQEEIVITGWTPHWMFIQYDLKILEDPEGVFGEGEDIITIAREGLQEDNPIAHQILDNFSWDVKDLQQIMYYIQDMPPEKAAATWIEDNPDKVAKWTEGVSLENK